MRIELAIPAYETGVIPFHYGAIYAPYFVFEGDCYDTPFYTRVVDVVDETGAHIGYQEIMVKRAPSTLNKDLLDGVIVLKKA